MTTKLAVEHLGKKFRDKTVLDDLTLHIDNGEIVGLLGPNGAGKTTCFYAIVGLLKPDRGAIQLNGRDITNLPIHKRAKLGLAYLPQDRSIFRDLTALENIVAIVEIGDNQGAKKNRKKAESLLESMQIAHLANVEGGKLSGGEQRRVEIARMLALNPVFILLDEPFAAIAPIAVAELQDIIFSLRARGIGIFITDHNVRETLKICDRAYIMDDGRIIVEGTPQAIVADKNVRRVYLGDSFGGI